VSTVSRNRRRTAGTLAAAAALALLAGCATDSAESYTENRQAVYDAVDGISLDSTYVKARNVYLLERFGTRPPILSMTLVNPTDTTDTLIGAQVGEPAIGGLLERGQAGGVTLPPNSSVAFGALPPSPTISFDGLDAPAGTFVPVTLIFRSGVAVTGEMLVQTAASVYSDGTVPRFIEGAGATPDPSREPVEGGHSEGGEEGEAAEAEGGAEGELPEAPVEENDQ
jgi:hypothetical protein